jgi:hypothetical protein
VAAVTAIDLWVVGLLCILLSILSGMAGNGLAALFLGLALAFLGRAIAQEIRGAFARAER